MNCSDCKKWKNSQLVCQECFFTNDKCIEQKQKLHTSIQQFYQEQVSQHIQQIKLNQEIKIRQLKLENLRKQVIKSRLEIQEFNNHKQIILQKLENRMFNFKNICLKFQTILEDFDKFQAKSHILRKIPFEIQNKIQLSNSYFHNDQLIQNTKNKQDNQKKIKKQRLFNQWLKKSQVKHEQKISCIKNIQTHLQQYVLQMQINQLNQYFLIFKLNHIFPEFDIFIEFKEETVQHYQNYEDIINQKFSKQIALNQKIKEAINFQYKSILNFSINQLAKMIFFTQKIFSYPLPYQMTIKHNIIQINDFQNQSYSIEIQNDLPLDHTNDAITLLFLNFIYIQKINKFSIDQNNYLQNMNFQTFFNKLKHRDQQNNSSYYPLNYALAKVVYQDTLEDKNSDNSDEWIICDQI